MSTCKLDRARSTRRRQFLRHCFQSSRRLPDFFCSWQRSNGVFLTTVTALKRSSPLVIIFHQDWRSAGRALLCMGMAAIEGFRLRQVPPISCWSLSDFLGHQFFRRPQSAVLHFSSCFRFSGISCYPTVLVYRTGILQGHIGSNKPWPIGP